MGTNVADIFERVGTVVQSAGNRPWLLDDPNTVWLVRTGWVNVFAVSVHHGRPVGVRRHLFRVDAGQALFGMGLRGGPESQGLLAVGNPGSELARAPRTALTDLPSGLSNPAIAELIDPWIACLSSTLSRDSVPQKHVPLSAGADYSLQDGESARVQQGVLWCRLLEGRARFLGRDDLSFEPSPDLWPLGERTWIQAFGPARIQILPTTAVLEFGPPWETLDRFHGLVLDRIRETIGQTERMERERLRLQTAGDRSAIGQAVTSLASVLSEEIRFERPEAGPTDPLLTACRYVADAMGIDVHPPIRGKTGTEPQDPLGAIARASRFRIRRVALRDDWWRRDNGPILAFMENDERPVALLPVGPKRYELLDPKEMSRTPVTSDVAQTVVSFGYVFYHPFHEKALTALDLLRFGLQGAPRRDLLSVLFMGLAGGVLAMFTPIATGIVFDAIIPGAERWQLLQITLALAVMAFGTAMFRLTRNFAVLRAESRMSGVVQAGIWDRLLKLPAPFFRQFLTGDLARRSLGIESIRRILTGATLSSLMGGIFSVFSYLLLFYYDTGLALVATVLVLVAVLATGLASYLGLRYQTRLQQIQGKIEGLVLQLITGLSKLRVAGAEARTFALWAGAFTEQKRLAFQAGTVANSLEVFNAAFPVVASLVIFSVMAYQTYAAVAVGETAMSIGSFLAFNAAFGQFLAAALETSSVLASVLQVAPIYDRARPILETPPEVDPAKPHPGQLSGDIEISHVSFRYHSDGPLVLNDVSLHVRPGEFVAVVGSSGAGKSTIFRLLLGFESPVSGSVYYDGQDVANVDVQAVRSQIGVVLQNAQVLPGSIFDNIVGSAPLTLDDAVAAARMAGLDEDIEQMPMGMHTLVSEGGSTLSGGQRQRLLIARAVASRPRILLFDEATSALDNRTQLLVAQSLERLRVARVVIAHRLSTVMHADRIYVVEGGRIVQTGTYEALFNQDGPFANLAKRQIV